MKEKESSRTAEENIRLLVGSASPEAPIEQIKSPDLGININSKDSGMMPWSDSLPESRGWRLPTYCTCPEHLLVVKKVDLYRFCVFWQPSLFHSIRVRCCVAVLILS